MWLMNFSVLWLHILFSPGVRVRRAVCRMCGLWANKGSDNTVKLWDRDRVFTAMYNYTELYTSTCTHVWVEGG